MNISASEPQFITDILQFVTQGILSSTSRIVKYISGIHSIFII